MGSPLETAADKMLEIMRRPWDGLPLNHASEIVSAFLIAVVACPSCGGTGDITIGATLGVASVFGDCPAEHVELSFCKYADPAKCEFRHSTGFIDGKPGGEHWDATIRKFVLCDPGCGYLFKASAVTEALETP